MLCIILFPLFALALAAPLDPPPVDLSFVKNLTATNRCSDSPDWQAHAFLVEDCFTAIQRVYIEEVLHKPTELYEFLAQGTSPTTQNPWVRTPAQYTREVLPGRGRGGYSPSDTVTFRDIWAAARVVEGDCLLPTRRPGWDVVGYKSSIGVFLWATDSSINDRVAGREMESS
ncbi:MAG: hypothetical protein Q9161_008680 [Pseudevernia consocians]